MIHRVTNIQWSVIDQMLVDVPNDMPANEIRQYIEDKIQDEQIMISHSFDINDFDSVVANDQVEARREYREQIGEDEEETV